MIERASDSPNGRIWWRNCWIALIDGQRFTYAWRLFAIVIPSALICPQVDRPPSS